MTHHAQHDIRAHMRVLGADGEPVGTVDRLEGERLKLTRASGAEAGQHHWLALSLVASVEGDSVRLSVPADAARRSWEAEAAIQSPLGEARPAGIGGPFTGTGGTSEAHRPETARRLGSGGEPGPRPDKPLPETPSRDKDRDMRR